MRKHTLTPEEKRLKRQQILKERSAKIYIKITGIFLLFLLLAGVFNLFSKDKEFSETENRMLAQKPEFSFSSLASGKYMSDIEAYVTDQFFIRDKWISLKLLQDMALGKRESNGVYIGKNDYLLEVPSAPNQKSLDANLKAISSFAIRHQEAKAVMSLVPNAAYICDQLTPKNAPVRNQEKDIEHIKKTLSSSLNYVDLTRTMSNHKTEPIYYKTDHHWTSLGAKYAFDTLYVALDIKDPVQLYDIYPVTHSFSGTLAAKSGYDKAKDTIEIYVPKDVDTDYIVNYVDEQEKSASIYNSKALKNKDKYEVFFGGNHSRIDISSPLNEKKNLLVFKDSYANCFIPFLLPYYRNIIIIDPRYFYDDIDKLMKDNEITDVLFLYNVNTFMTDNSLADVLAEN